MLVIRVNGEKKELERELSLLQLIQHMNFPTQRFAIAVNRNVIPRSEIDRTFVKDGDEVEVVHAVGGG